MEAPASRLKDAFLRALARWARRRDKAIIDNWQAYADGIVKGPCPVCGKNHDASAPSV